MATESPDPAPRRYPDAVKLWRRLDGDAGPGAGTPAEVEAWLLGDAIAEADFLELFHALCWRLASAGLGVDRASAHFGTLHPSLIGYAWNWSRLDGLTDEVRVEPEVLLSDAYRGNPLYRVREFGERLRMNPAAATGESKLMAELAAEGFTEYLALPLGAGRGPHDVATLATRRPGGFAPEALVTLRRLLALLALHIERHIALRIAGNTLAAYLGANAGGQVLAGSIKRGDGRTIRAVVWLSDLRGFTQLSSRLSGPDMTALLNAYFEALTGAVMTEGGEVLKFVGDGLLAVFPYSDDDEAPVAAAAALRASQAGLAAQARLNADPATLPGVDGWRPLRSGVGLHLGEIFFGNVGAPERLDFTVIGQAVNVASRVEAMTKTLGRPVLMTEAVARLLPADAVEDLGVHPLRDIADPVRLFAPAVAMAADARAR